MSRNRHAFDATDPTGLTPPSVTLSDRDFQKVSDIVYRLAGINLHAGKRELVLARLSKRIRQLGMNSVGEYLVHVREQRTQEELITMLDALSTNLTSFWRESQHFDYVVQKTIPAIAARSRQGGDRRIRGWSAGCSTGEEPYGLAMLFLHHLDQADRYDLQVLATDLSTRVLGVARTGIYSAERVKPIPKEIRRRFVEEETTPYGKQYRVSSEVKQHVRFARLNLMDDWPMKGPFDFVFCRNVMIYFDKPTQARLVKRFCDLLRPGGTLFVGHSESLAGVDHDFRYVRPTVYERP